MKLQSKIIGRKALTKVLKDKDLQESKAAESQKTFREKPYVGNLIPNVMVRKK